MPAPKSQANSTSTAVDAITHSDKRANLPTADAYEFVAPEIESLLKLRYPRDPTLDPQLVWKGKDAQDREDLVAEAPPIYIQDKVDPRVIIEDLRASAGQSHDEAMRLFETFDGLDEMEIVDFYRHQANWSNRMILGDSLNVMASLAEREGLRGKVQMIYLDPPYGIKFGSNWQTSTRRRDVKDGKVEDVTREVEQIKAFRDTWELGIHSYLSYLRDRLMLAKDLLTESGSIFVQIGDENVHLVRSLMDEVFGPENLCAQVTFMTTTGATAEVLPGVNDYLLWYARERALLKFRLLYFERSVANDQNFRFLDQNGDMRPLDQSELSQVDSLRAAGARIFRINPLTSQTGGSSTIFPVNLNGRVYTPTKGGWKTNAAGMERLRAAGRLRGVGRTLSFVRYFDDFPFQSYSTVWTDTRQSGFGDPKVYVVQTATRVIERCLLMSTDPGDLVLDPTCGSGTTAYVAEQWGRRWITIDTSRVALALARQRLMGARFPWYLLADSAAGRRRESELTGHQLPPAEVTNDIRHGFVYERVQHVTLKSIANNPDIKEGMSREEIDAVIRRHAEYELLYDKPHEDPRKVRVSGPFTVESLSPHRSLALVGSAIGEPTELNMAREVVIEKETSFQETVLSNLRIAGIQNGRRGERLKFDAVEPYASPHIQAIGERLDTTDSAPKRVGITIGPQYGTVSPTFIKDAAREAIHAHEVDLLCVLAFAFEPQVVGTGEDYVTSDEGFASVAAERQLGRMPVLLVRMNADLVMGEELKKTDAANLFTVFGEPDIEVVQNGGHLQVVLKGVDVYDPNTGQVRSNNVDQVALWMVDTAYNEESFFVRQCYFTGGQDPYARLKRALKADISEEAWATLYRTESRPFARPDTGKIAVKVIDDYGDEVMKVFEV